MQAYTCGVLDRWTDSSKNTECFRLITVRHHYDISQEAQISKFWSTAVAVCGLSGVAAFVFWSLYKQWLTLPIFVELSQQQTFIVMLVFLGLTFAALLVMLFTYLRRPTEGTNKQIVDLPLLTKALEGVRAPNPQDPNLDMAHRALSSMRLIAWYWKNASPAERALILKECLGPYLQWFGVLDSHELEMSDGKTSRQHLEGVLSTTYEEMRNDDRAGNPS